MIDPVTMMIIGTAASKLGSYLGEQLVGSPEDPLANYNRVQAPWIRNRVSSLRSLSADDIRGLVGGIVQAPEISGDFASEGSSLKASRAVTEDVTRAVNDVNSALKLQAAKENFGRTVGALSLGMDQTRASAGYAGEAMKLGAERSIDNWEEEVEKRNRWGQYGGLIGAGAALAGGFAFDKWFAPKSPVNEALQTGVSNAMNQSVGLAAKTTPLVELGTEGFGKGAGGFTDALSEYALLKPNVPVVEPGIKEAVLQGLKVRGDTGYPEGTFHDLFAGATEMMKDTINPVVNAYSTPLTEFDDGKSIFAGVGIGSIKKFETLPIEQKVDSLRHVLAKNETSDDSSSYSKIVESKDKNGSPQAALGKYGIMRENLRGWLDNAGFTEISEHEFLHGAHAKEIQDQVVKSMIEKKLANGYSWQEILLEWFTGGKEEKHLSRRDAFGTTGAEYVRRGYLTLQQMYGA